MNDFICPGCGLQTESTPKEFYCKNKECKYEIEILFTQSYVSTVKYWDLFTNKNKEYVLASDAISNNTYIFKMPYKNIIISINQYMDIYTLSASDIEKLIQRLFALKEFA